MKFCWKINLLLIFIYKDLLFIYNNKLMNRMINKLQDCGKTLWD